MHLLSQIKGIELYISSILHRRRTWIRVVTMLRHIDLFALLIAAVQCSALGRGSAFFGTRTDSADTTGMPMERYIVVLHKTTSHDRIIELAKLLDSSIEGCKVYGYVEVAVKALTLELSNGALQEVRSHIMAPARRRIWARVCCVHSFMRS